MCTTSTPSHVPAPDLVLMAVDGFLYFAFLDNISWESEATTQTRSIMEGYYDQLNCADLHPCFDNIATLENYLFFMFP